MSRVLPSVTVLLLERDHPASQRQREAWDDCLAAYPADGAVRIVWAGGATAPGSFELGSLGAAGDVLGLDPDDVVVVAEASATPGPGLLERLVTELLAAPDAVVDARVLPVELTRVDDRSRGLHLPDGSDPTAEFLEELRHPAPDVPDDRASLEMDDTPDGTSADEALRPETPAVPRVEDGVSDHELRVQDGSTVRPRVTAACSALRAAGLVALEKALVAAPDDESGAALLRAATDRALDVVVAETAAVALPVRLDWDARVNGSLSESPEWQVEWATDTHPALLPASSLGMIASQLGLPLAPAAPAEAEVAHRRPFLSIVTRTQGKRLHCLEDMFTCLAAQTDRDFEVLVVTHRVEEADRAAVQDVVGALPGWLHDVTRIVPAERPGRAAPLNEGFAAANGRYVVALDDDDTVLAHYVETFHKRASTCDGRVLRVATVRQDVAPVVELDTLCAVSVDDPFREWPMDFELVAHLTANYSPFMSMAFPRGAFHDLGLRFDEGLHTTEDWDFLVRCAAVLGVESIREVTCVYRWWVHTGSSREAHTPDEWREAEERVRARIDEAVLLLQPSETGRLVGSLERARRDVIESHQLARDFATSQHETNLKMAVVDQDHRKAMAKATAAEKRVEKLRGDLRDTRQKLRRRTARLRMLEARLRVEERLRAGTLTAPDVPLADLSVEQLEDLAQRPVVRTRRLLFRR